MIKDKQALEGERISILGARIHGLRSVDVEVPRGKLTMITDMSGSGKSSLAFDTIFAEGQRRYIETLSAYARSFLGNMEELDVDKTAGPSPVISTEQKTTNKNPRSTVGTATEIYDFFRLFYARVGEAYPYLSGEKMVKYTEDQALRLILGKYNGKKTYPLAPLIYNRKGHYKELFKWIRKKGYLNTRVDDELKKIFRRMKLDRYRIHSIEVVIGKMIASEAGGRRLREGLKIAMKQGDDLVLILDAKTNETRHCNRRLVDPVTGLSYSKPVPHNFSLNSPQEACPKCKGLGQVNLLNMDKIVPDPSLSVYSGGIVALGRYKNSLTFWRIETLCQRHDVTIRTPIWDIPKGAMGGVMDGTDERLQIKNDSLGSPNYFLSYEGVARYVLMQQESEASASAQKWTGQFVKMATCPERNGRRLNKEALGYRIAGKNIAELSAMDISELYEWLEDIEEELDPKQLRVATEILKGIRSHLRFLLDMELDYLSMNRGSATLSGGKNQRIRLATQIGGQLVSILYILDEPSIGLHQRDNVRLTNSLKRLCDTGNSVIVVEHDKDMMLSVDYVVDMGPKAGRLDDEVVFEGTSKEILRVDTLTSSYLNEDTEIAVPAERRRGDRQFITIKGASSNSLKYVDVSFPLGTLICVTGVPGSGKSTLVNHTLQPILSQHFYHSLEDPLAYDVIKGIERVDKVVNVDQPPIGRSPRGNPVTYTGVFSDIRNLLMELPESEVGGYKPGRFSFNVSGRRCETYKGNGYKMIEMSSLSDMLVPREDCHGKRYNRKTLEVRFRGKSIAGILDITINMAMEFFENIPTILSRVKILQDVGLGYIKLGQPSTTLSGGESQRVKLTTELARRDTGETLYVLDKPATGLYSEDIRVLLGVLNKLVNKGDAIIVIEHNLDVIKNADYLIDMGPEDGRHGGNVLPTGTPEALTKSGVGFAAPFLKEELDTANKKK